MQSHPSSIQTLLSVPEFNRFSPVLPGVADYTAGRELHPALKNAGYFFLTGMPQN
jgi:hypothetical protein